MSFKNYQNINFINNQSISYQELNNLNSNDYILNNAIKNMPRGVLAFRSGYCLDTYDTVLNSLADDETDSGYEMLEFDTPSFNKVFFNVENLRLIKFSFFAPTFVDELGSYFITKRSNAADAPSRGRGFLELAFFLEENNSEKYLLNSNFRTNQIVSTAPQGAIYMTYTTTLPAGRHAVSIGLKGSRSRLFIGSPNRTTFSPCQIYVEDLGSYTPPNAEVEI